MRRSPPKIEDASKMRMIERALEIGMLAQVRLELDLWGESLEVTPEYAGRMAAARVGLTVKERYEEVHGLNSSLDRNAPEIIAAELDRQRGICTKSSQI